ncbi:MAG: phosphotransferase [Oscillospiraceae bacterium]|jgi:Ser/Thr protein kinase RdoA (MazF antagonist)|nr:phosphotransferase [Oscillospiraceae bacterium]
MEWYQDLLELAAKEYNFDINTFKVKEAFKWGNPPVEIFTFHKDGKKYIIDFEPGWLPQRRQTRAELDFICYLAENNISVAKPLKTINNELIISTQNNGKDFNITAFEMASGRFWDKNDPDRWNNKIFFNWGKLMGDMHRLAKDYKRSDKYDIPDIFDRDYEGWGSAFDCLKKYSKIYKITDELLGEFITFPRDRDSYGLIHCDMHQNNFHIDGDKINLFDFGDNIYAWFVLDIGIALFHALWWGRKDDKGNDFTKAIIDNFLKGYLSANHLSGFWLSKIPMFVKYRQISCFVPWFFNPEDINDSQREWIYNIENDIVFDDIDLKYISNIIKSVEI